MAASRSGPARAGDATSRVKFESASAASAGALLLGDMLARDYLLSRAGEHAALLRPGTTGLITLP
jgi:hypothetical protein